MTPTENPAANRSVTIAAAGDKTTAKGWSLLEDPAESNPLRKKQKLDVDSFHQAEATVAHGEENFKTTTNVPSGKTTPEEQNPWSSTEITEITTFLWGHQLDQGTHKPSIEEHCIFTQEDVVDHEQPKVEEIKADDDDGQYESKDAKDNGIGILHEVAIGKGLSGALKLLKGRGAFEKSTDGSGNPSPISHKKKSKGDGIKSPSYLEVAQLKDTRLRRHYENKEIRIDKWDEFGREMTPQQLFDYLSFKFHGKRPVKKRKEHRLKQYQRELKMKRKTDSKGLLSSMEWMQKLLNGRPYLILRRGIY